MQFLWLYIDELVGKGLGLGVILEFLFWGICTLLQICIPLAMMISSTLVLGNLGESNELLAIKAAGISLTRALAPLAIAAAIISVGAFYASNNLVPYAWNKIYTLRDDILKTKSEIKIPAKTFYDGIDGYIIRVEENDEETGMMKDVIIYDHTSTKGNTGVVIAERGYMKISDDKKFLNLHLYNGASYSEDNQKTYKDTSLVLNKIEFSEQDILVLLTNHGFQKTEQAKYGDEVNSMKLGDLVVRGDSLEIERTNLRDQHVERIFTDRSFKYNKQLNPMSTTKATATIDYDELAKQFSYAEQIQIAKDAKKRVNEYVATVTNLGMETYRHNYFIRRIDVAIYKKIAGALACLIFFFIGAPLGSILRRGGIGMAIIMSAIFFVTYWVIDITGTKLATDGAMAAFNGVFISAYVLVPIAAYITWKAIHDKSFTVLASIGAWFKMIKFKISQMFHKTRIIYMGTPEFAVAPLERLLQEGYDVAAVVTATDKPAGRGGKVAESAVKKFAVSKGIPVLQPEKLKDPAFLEQLASYKADLFVVVAFRMLPEVVFSMPRLGTFNLHAALLPQYRGAAPINWAVIKGETLTGVTTFKIDAGIDTGHIIFREQYKIKPTDDAGDVHDALMAIGTDLVSNTVSALIDDKVQLQLQKSFIQGEEVLHAAPKLTKELCFVDFDDTLEHVHNLVRGLSPYPGAFTMIAQEGAEASVEAGAIGTQLKIFKTAMDTSRQGTPGEIITDGSKYFGIACQGGVLQILELQLSGKKRMGVEDFLRGFRGLDTYHVLPGTSKAVLESVV